MTSKTYIEGPFPTCSRSDPAQLVAVLMVVLVVASTSIGCCVGCVALALVSWGAADV